MPESGKLEHLFLVDGSGFIFRAFHGLPPMTRADGTPVNAVYGFTQMLLKLVEDTDADHIAVIFDTARKTFRSDIYPEYKAHRPPPPDDLIPQFDLVRQATRAMNLPSIEMQGYEADDLIATYATQAAAQGAKVTIVSSDKDLMQLVGDNIEMMDAMRNRTIGVEGVIEKFGVGPEHVIDVQSLAGDSSDNVPGVPGIGVKTAALLVETYGDLDSILARAEEVKQPKRRQALIEHADMARISRELVTLCTDVPVTEPIENFVVREPDHQMLLDFLKEQSFKTLLTRMASKLGVDVEMPEAPPPAHATKKADKKTAKNDASVGDSSYELVQDAEVLEAWIAEALEAGVVAVDTETTSLNAMQAALVGVSMCIPGQPRACYIPVAHVGGAEQSSLDLGGDDSNDGGDGSAPKQISRDHAVKLLKPLLENPGVLKVGHNIKYDMEILARYGIDVTPVDDTMIMSYVLEGGAHGHGMDDLAKLHLAHQTIKFSDVAGSGKKQVTFDHVPLDKALDYAAEDADITAKLFNTFKPRLVGEQMTTVYEAIERPLINVLSDMERTGIKVDAKVLSGLSQDFAKRIAELEIEIHKLAGREFNVASPKQLGEILFDEMGLDGGKKTKTGAYATGADILEGLAADGHELPERVIDYRQLSKLKSTYTDTLIQQVDPDTGRVHTNYGQAIASTGRLSSNDPNLQNIPIRTEEGRKIRRAFVPDKGCVLMSADYSQIELRLLAHVAGIESLKEAFRDGMDIHAMTASQVFGVPIEGMDPMVRRQAKAINFGIIYGISAFGLARQLGISRGEASEYIKAYFAKYPGIRDYMEDAKEQAREHGYVTTLYGRKCYTPGINEKSSAHRAFSERAAINAPIQGGAADVIKRAMLKIPGALEAKKLKSRMLLQVHDELVFEVPEAELEKMTKLATEVMENVADLDVPLVVDTGHGANWEEAH